MKWKCSVPLLLLGAVPAMAAAQAPPSPESAAPARRVLSASTASGPIRLDGRLDEAAWAQAEPATDFTQSWPRAGAPASQRTEVRVLVDADALYVGARMFDSSPDSIVAQLSRRDESTTYSDRILLYVDSQNDRRTAFQFGVNPRGVKQDVYHYNDRSEDASWDAVWDVATGVDSLGWTAEFRIPLSQLRFGGRGGERVWGLGAMREIARLEERSTWSPWTRASTGFVSAFGELRNLDGVRPAQRLELMPYTSARLERSPGNAANPFYRSNAFGSSVGADVRYGLPGGLTLTGTINPDFGQVEADPAVVNLSAFESFFPERRPFFLEGMDIFRYGKVTAYNGYGADEPFYTRRIGRQPQGSAAGSDVLYVDAPEQSTILAAAKVSGRTAGGWSVGILDAVTSREDARVLTTTGESTSIVEPLSNYFVGRVRRDLNGGSTLLGGIVTAAHRESADGTFDAFLRSRGFQVGTDWEHSWARRAWTFSGFLSGSRADGSRRAIAATQRSSARYYRRPDADYLAYDTTLTTLGGYMGSVALARHGAWHGSLGFKTVSPGFEINDLGYLPRADYRAFHTLIGRRYTQPGRYFRERVFGLFSNHAWNFGGDLISNAVSVNAYGVFSNFWRGQVTFTHDTERFSDRQTFGGPVTELPSGWRVDANLSSDARRKLSGRVATSYAEIADGSYERTVSLSAAFRPTPSISVSAGPSLGYLGYNQFVQSVAAPLELDTYGRRYVFAEVDDRYLAMTTRLNWTFTPTLSLQLYARPFVNSLDFSSYKELEAPRTRDFAVYGKDAGTIATNQACGSRPADASIPTIDPDGAGPASCFQVPGFFSRDFSVRSLRGNAVLRWEYRPGSALFLVWQQTRDASHGFGEFDLDSHVRGIWDEPARNIFLIKATYWLSR